MDARIGNRGDAIELLDALIEAAEREGDALRIQALRELRRAIESEII